MRPDKCLTCSGSKSLHSDSIPERSFYDAADILAKKSNSCLSIRVVLFLKRAITPEIFFGNSQAILSLIYQVLKLVFYSLYEIFLVNKVCVTHTHMHACAHTYTHTQTDRWMDG